MTAGFAAVPAWCYGNLSCWQLDVILISDTGSMICIFSSDKHSHHCICYFVTSVSFSYFIMVLFQYMWPFVNLTLSNKCVSQCHWKHLNMAVHTFLLFSVKLERIYQCGTSELIFHFLYSSSLQYVIVFWLLCYSCHRKSLAIMIWTI